MSFTSVVKRELCKLQIKNRCCAKAELLGIICFGSVIKDNTLIVKVSNNAVVKRITYLTEFYFGFSPAVETIEKKKGKTYIIQIAGTDKLSLVLEDMNLIKNSHDMKNFVLFSLSQNIAENDCCKTALMRGAFLISGSCTEPDTRYHLEISSPHRKAVKELCDLLEEFDLKPKVITRNSNYHLYLKNAEQICDFLGRIGSVKSLLEFHSIRVMKEFSNNMNRAVNCEIANKEKTRNAAELQIDAIYKIDRVIGLSNLDENLRKVAILRCEYTELTLTELGKMTEPALSKSGVNHRLKKIIEIANKL